MAKLLTANEKTDEQVTKNLNLKELEYYDKIPTELLDNARTLCKNLQVLRDACGKPIFCMSGYRSPERNEKVGGAAKSIHQTAGAADIKIKGMDPKEVAALIEQLIKSGKMLNGGLGVYPRATPEEGWVHYDCRCNLTGVKDFPKVPARWNG
jgi:uncharacterized protein YcbK (DUF882 family)